jgi:Flp pilus assembly protein TadG
MRDLRLTGQPKAPRPRVFRRAASLRHQLGSREEGSGLVEYGLICIVFLTMLFGIIDFGRALYAYHFVSNAAREATRYAAVRGSTCTDDGSCTNDGNCTSFATTTCIPTYVSSIAPPGIDTSQLTTSACGVQGGSECAESVPTGCSTTVNAPGCTAGVQVSYNFSFLFPFVRSKSITLSSTSEMVIAH